MVDTVDALSNALSRGRSILEAADLPESLQEVAFQVILTELLGSEVHQGGSKRKSEFKGASDALGLLERIAAKSERDIERVKAIYEEENGGLSLVVGSRKIDPSLAAGARELTLLASGGRQAAGLEEWTPLVVAREWCQRYSRFDSSNFATAIKSDADKYAFKGSGASRQVRLTMPGWEAWSQLLERLAGED